MTNLKGVADHAESTLGKTVSELTEDDLTTGEPTSEYSCVLASWRPLCERCFSAV